MNVVDKIVDGVVSGILDKKAFPESSANVPGSIPAKESFEDFDAGTLLNKFVDIIKSSPTLQEEINSITKNELIEKSVSHAPSDGPIPQNRMTVLGEVNKVEKSEEYIAQGVDVLKAAAKKNEEDKEKSESSLKDVLAESEAEEEERMELAKAQTEEIINHVKEYGKKSFFKRILENIVPILFGTGVLALYRDKIVAFLTRIVYSIAEWLKHNYPDFFNGLKSTIDTVKMIWEKLQWVVDKIAILLGGTDVAMDKENQKRVKQGEMTAEEAELVKKERDLFAPYYEPDRKLEDNRFQDLLRKTSDAQEGQEGFKNVSTEELISMRKRLGELKEIGAPDAVWRNSSAGILYSRIVQELNIRQSLEEGTFTPEKDEDLDKKEHVLTVLDAAKSPWGTGTAVINGQQVRPVLPDSAKGAIPKEYEEFLESSPQTEVATAPLYPVEDVFSNMPHENPQDVNRNIVGMRTEIRTRELVRKRNIYSAQD